ncbi:MAG TPA: sulfite exporter TauE/SafE family protein, partial [Verrucomicrobiae bacterium]|nr:sulfite exporter TauE/SafE family protein [Verrucomicrobiae bacterium]
KMNWLFLVLTLACAGFVQGLSGFGFGMVSMALMPLFMGVKQAAVISTAFTLLATLITFARHYREYNWRFGFGFLVSVVLGVPLGVYFLERGSERFIMGVMGALMLAYALREFLSPGEARPFPRAWTIPLGVFTGAISGAFNLGGVPGSAYAWSNPWKRGQIMAFLQVMISTNCLLRMFFYRKAGLLAGISWPHTLLLIVPLYGAIWLGHLALQRLDPKWIRGGIFSFIGLTGFYYLVLR